MLTALSFLTVIPANSVPGPWNTSPTHRQISNSRAFYPAVGLLLGAMLLGLQLGCRQVFPSFLSGAMLLMFLVVVNRGFHLDGLMDTCDGLFGGFSRERRLEIMRDSRLGAFGVAGGVGVLALKYGALVSLLGYLPWAVGWSTTSATGAITPWHSLETVGWSLLLFPMLSRWSMVVALGAFPYARGQGLGSPFHQGGAGWPTAVAGATAVVAAVLLGGAGGAGLLAGATAVAWLLGRVMTAQLGGLTGDTYGAINEVVEALALMAAVAMLPHGWVAPLTATVL